MADFSQKNRKKCKNIFHIFTTYWDTNCCKNGKIPFFPAMGGGAYLANGQYRIRKYRRCCRDDVHIVPTAIQNGKNIAQSTGIPVEEIKGM